MPTIAGLLLSLTCALPAHADAPPHVQAAIDGFDVYISSFLKSNKLIGAAVAVVHGERIVHLKGYGVRSAKDSEPVDEHTVFRIASVSKGFASTLAAVLAKDGTLDLDDPVVKFIPEFALKDAAHTRKVSVRHILSQTSGVVPYAYDNLIEHGVPIARVHKELRKARLICKPGQCYSYQNVIFSLFSDVARMAAGKSYEQLVGERLLTPLGMKSASLGLAGFLASKNRAMPHVRRRGQWRMLKTRKRYYAVQPAAGINASATDMAQWLRAQMGAYPEVLPREVLKSLHAPAIRTPQERRRFSRRRRLKRAHYAMGWRVFDYAGHTMVFHSGGVRGYFAQLGFIPEKQIGIVILRNSGSGSELFFEFFDRLLLLKK
jgi:beta-lactamase class C